MAVLIWMVRPWLYLRYAVDRIFKTGAFGQERAQFFQPPLPGAEDTLKALLLKFHVKQFHGSSCSVASVASIVNVLLERQGKAPNTAVTQQELLERVTTAHWKERMSDTGYKGRRGLPLKLLGDVVRNSLDTYSIRYKDIRTVQVSGDSGQAKKDRQELRSRLLQFETRDDCLLIAHFNQGIVLPELHIPHISPVGGYDAASGMVTLLDVDTTLPYPYRISFDIFYKSLSNRYNPVFRYFGYAEGGYVLIKV